VIADVALVLALSWWVFLAWFVFAIRRAARDPQLPAKLMRKISTMSQPKQKVSTDG